MENLREEQTLVDKKDDMESFPSLEAEQANFIQQINNAVKKTEENQPCLICGDRASGRHYGVMACDGCRGFFKRSVRRSNNYQCRDQMKCVVNLERRNQCQCCRLRKCFMVGMRKEAVQHQRPPRNGKLPEGKNKGDNKKSHYQDVPQPSNKPYARVTEFVCAPTMVKQPSPPPSSPPNTSNVSDKRVEITSAKELYDVSIRILYETIAWAKNIPTFMELPVSDQACLLENAWSELFLLSIAQWNIPLDLDYLIDIGRDSVENEIENEENGVFNVEKDVIDALLRLQNINRKFHIIDLDTMEFACVKAIVVFKPDLSDLKCRAHIDHLQEQAQLTLLDYCSTRSKSRFGKILLKLPLLREISASVIKKHFLKGHLNLVGASHRQFDDVTEPSRYHRSDHKTGLERRHKYLSTQGKNVAPEFDNENTLNGQHNFYEQSHNGLKYIEEDSEKTHQIQPHLLKESRYTHHYHKSTDQRSNIEQNSHVNSINRYFHESNSDQLFHESNNQRHFQGTENIKHFNDRNSDQNINEHTEAREINENYRTSEQNYSIEQHMSNKSPDAYSNKQNAGRYLYERKNDRSSYEGNKTKFRHDIEEFGTNGYSNNEASVYSTKMPRQYKFTNFVPETRKESRKRKRNSPVHYIQPIKSPANETIIKQEDVSFSPCVESTQGSPSPTLRIDDNSQKCKESEIKKESE